MEYLKREHDKYRDDRNKGKSVEEIFGLKAFAFKSLINQISPFLKRNSKIMETGFGSGYGLSLLAERGHSVHGVETSPRALEYAKRVFHDRSQKGSLSLGNGFNLEQKSESFDFSFNVGTVEHFKFEDQVDFVKEMSRVSRDKVLISTPNDNPNSLYQKFKEKSSLYYPEEENFFNLEELAENSGLKPIKSGGYHLVATPELANDKLRSLYNQKGFDLPRSSYHPSEFNELMDFELSLRDSERSNFGFLKYVLAENK